MDLEEKAEDPIWDLAKTAEAETSIEVRHRSLLFPTVLDENGARKLSAVPYAGVKDDGAITWLDYPQRFEPVTVADMERTKEDGLFQGDPHATILDLPDIGNGGIVQTWPDLLQWLFGIGGVYGGLRAVIAIPRAVVRRFRKRRSSEAAWLAEFVERHRERWEGRGARGPADFLAVLLAPRQWDFARLRRLLQI